MKCFVQSPAWLLDSENWLLDSLNIRPGDKSEGLAQQAGSTGWPNRLAQQAGSTGGLKSWCFVRDVREKVKRTSRRSAVQAQNDNPYNEN